jgi:hypothetical protein
MLFDDGHVHRHEDPRAGVALIDRLDHVGICASYECEVSDGGDAQSSRAKAFHQLLACELLIQTRSGNLSRPPA